MYNKTMTNYYDEDYIKNLPISDIRELYYNQYDEDKDIPEIDREGAEVVYVYTIYIYKLEDGRTNYNKYICRVEEDNSEEEVETAEYCFDCRSPIKTEKHKGGRFWNLDICECKNPITK